MKNLIETIKFRFQFKIIDAKVYLTETKTLMENFDIKLFIYVAEMVKVVVEVAGKREVKVAITETVEAVIIEITIEIEVMETETKIISTEIKVVTIETEVTINSNMAMVTKAMAVITKVMAVITKVMAVITKVMAVITVDRGIMSRILDVFSTLA